MNNQIILMVILAIIVVLVGAVLWYKGQKQIVLKALGYMVHKAEVYFSAGKNQEKINFVLNKIKKIIPIYLQWLWNEEWIKKQVTIILLKVEKDLGYQSQVEIAVNATKKDIMQKVDAYVESSISGATNYFTSQLLAANVNGDPNLVDNNQINLINSELQKQIKLGVNLRAFANAKTDFKGNSQGTVGIELEKQF
jgi:hypothetical protein